MAHQRAGAGIARSADGPQAILPYSYAGTMGLVQGGSMDRRLFHLLGASRLARRFAEVTFFADNRSDLQHVRVPSLIMQCSDDMIAPDHIGEYMHQNTPMSSLRRMQATGHCPHMSAPAETIAAMRDYLAAADGA